MSTKNWQENINFCFHGINIVKSSYNFAATEINEIRDWVLGTFQCSFLGIS